MVLDFITRCLNYEPNYRPLSEELLKSQWMLHIAKLNKEEEDRLAREAAQEVLKLDEMKTQATEDAWRLRKWKEQFPSADTYYHQVGFLEEMEKPDDTVEHETEDKKIDASITENAPNPDPISIRAPTIHPLCVVEGDEQEQSDTDSGTESTDSSYDSKLTTSTQHALPFSTDKMLDRRATTALEIINSSSKTFLCEHTIASNSKIVLMPITTQRKRVCSTSQAVVTPSKEQQIAESRKKFVMQKKLKEFRQKHEYLEKRKTKKQKQNIVGDNCLPKKYRKNVLKRLQSDDDTVTNTTITAECVVVSCKPMN